MTEYPSPARVVPLSVRQMSLTERVASLLKPADAKQAASQVTVCTELVLKFANTMAQAPEERARPQTFRSSRGRPPTQARPTGGAPFDSSPVDALNTQACDRSMQQGSHTPCPVLSEQRRVTCAAALPCVALNRSSKKRALGTGSYTPVNTRRQGIVVFIVR